MTNLQLIKKARLWPPCGRCREMIYQSDNANLKTEVIVSENKTVPLEKLLPRRWQDSWRS